MSMKLKKIDQFFVKCLLRWLLSPCVSSLNTSALKHEVRRCGKESKVHRLTNEGLDSADAFV